MVTPTDTTLPAQTTSAHTAPRFDGSHSARLWHFRLMRATLRSSNAPAASARPGTRTARLSSDARHHAAARKAA